MKTIGKFDKKINNLEFDDFGRPSGILLIDKPINISSHGVVDQVRRLLHIRQVGHGGALDIFASGLEIILVGKATKLSEEMLLLDKAYQATMVFGVATETQDIEGKIVNVISSGIKLTKEQVEKTLKTFEGTSEQFVSPFSSIKVNGRKLRKILRDPNYTYVIDNTKDGKRLLSMTCLNKPENNYVLEIPKRKIILENIKLIDFGYKQVNQLNIKDLKIDFPLPYCEFSLKCSKGTYIRQLAEDIGQRHNLPATLIQLDRIAIGSWDKTQAITLEELETKLNSK